MRKGLSLVTILLSVLSGFIVLKFTDNYFLWFISVIISTIVFGTVFRLVMYLVSKANRKKQSNKEDG